MERIPPRCASRVFSPDFQRCGGGGVERVRRGGGAEGRWKKQKRRCLGWMRVYRKFISVIASILSFERGRYYTYINFKILLSSHSNG